MPHTGAGISYSHLTQGILLLKDAALALSSSHHVAPIRIPVLSHLLALRIEGSAVEEFLVPEHIYGSGKRIFSSFWKQFRGKSC